MICPNCHNQNEPNDKFCTTCGMELNNNNNNPTPQTNDNKKVPTLSWVAFAMLIMQMLSLFIKSSAIKNMPWLIASFVIAIISRIKNKDVMSLVIIIIDVILLLLAIVLIVIFIFILGSLFTELGPRIIEFFNGVGSIG